MDAPKPVISEDALADLDEIWLYIAKNSVKAADKVADKIYAAIYLLADYPRMGHLREDLTDLPLRFWSVFDYLIVYKPDVQPIEVARVLRGQRDIKLILKQLSDE